jgi:hypothetical protein
MPEYTRPVIEAREFRDEFGAVIRYGTRWTGSPPDDSYSHVSNPERFAPLQIIADALIEHLRAAYRADIAALAKSPTTSATTKLIAVTPEQADAAPLVFRFTGFPGVELRAGVRYSAAFPSCGCDACDETWEDAADNMERLVFAVTDGRFSERIVLPPRSAGKATVEYRIEGGGGGVGSGVSHGVEPDPALRDDAARLDRLPTGRWQPWTR